MSTAPSPLDAWPEFMAAIQQRLKKGAVEYGDASLSRPPSELAEEIEEELLDVCGWAFFLWLKIRKIEKREMSRKSNIP
jgi:hypothetical protein